MQFFPRCSSLMQQPYRRGTNRSSSQRPRPSRRPARGRFFDGLEVHVARRVRELPVHVARRVRELPVLREFGEKPADLAKLPKDWKSTDAAGDVNLKLEKELGRMTVSTRELSRTRRATGFRRKFFAMHCLAMSRPWRSDESGLVGHGVIVVQEVCGIRTNKRTVAV